ncbi:MAG: FAD-dependent oxidoreductase [Deltaproteobacteria bacterium]|nr:FAD-dependent oxidoreductase [Deltaproteobacteria bacterium]
MKKKSKYQKLFEPGYIGGVRIKNRSVKTGAQTCLYQETDGHVIDTCRHFYEATAKGGVGAIYVEGPAIDPPLSNIGIKGLRIDDDKYIKSFKDLTSVIHKHDCPAFLQLLHAGPWHQSFVTGLQPVSSSIPPEFEYADRGLDPPRELTIAEIEQIIDKFASAALRARKAGFDGVDINAAASHLLCSFMSEFLNSRKDDYGGTLENRVRIVVSIIKEIKKRAGQDFSVGVVINGVDVKYKGSRDLAIREGQKIAKLLEASGANSFQVRSYQYGYIGSLWPEQSFYPEPFEPLPEELDWSRKGAGAYVPLAAEIKKVVSIPVITVGRLDAEIGETVLQEGRADFIGMCRRLLADPELPNKLAQGRPEDIAPCTACLHCLEQVRFHNPVRCRINASLGRGSDFDIKAAEKKKKVLVAGGGPAGMEAARSAAMRGHDVILYAKERKLGGLLPTAALVKGTEIEDLVAFIRYFKTQLDKLAVDVRLGQEVTLSVVETVKPQVVIFAVGGVPTFLDIPGINSPNVIHAADIHKKMKIWQRFFSPNVLSFLTRFWMPMGKRVVIIGGAMQGCELAEFLTLRGRDVTIVDKAEELGEGLGSEKMSRLFKWMAIKGVSTITGVRSYEKISDNVLTIINSNGEEQLVFADTVIIALPAVSDTGFMEKLEGKIPEIYQIGDCREPGLIANAVADGAKLARKI